MKPIITALFALFVATAPLSAQQLTVRKSPSAQEALTKIERQRKQTDVVGYRVGIFFDNGQDARQKATEAKELFEENFPTQPVYILYESPYYKVSGGNCLTEEEAIMLFERIRKVFPNAYVMRETMKISDFVDDQSILVPQADSLSQPAEL